MPVPVPPSAPPIAHPVVLEVSHESPAEIATSAAKPSNSAPAARPQSHQSSVATPPSPPETFPPEYFAPTATTAETLGTPISAGYVKPATSTYKISTSASIPTFQVNEASDSPFLNKVRAIATTVDSKSQQPSPQLARQIPSRTNLPNLSPRTRKSQEINNTRFVTQERGGAVREFEVITPPFPPETPASPEPQPLPSQQVAPTDTIEITSDRQEYDQNRDVVTAEGNAVMRFSKGVLSADRVQVNLQNRIVVADGDVALKRGDQLMRGERFEYFFVQDRGTIFNARGDIYQKTFPRDTAPRIDDATVLARPLSDRLLANQPLQGIWTDEGYQFTLGRTSGPLPNIPFSEPGSQGTVNRQRFEADRVEFEGDTWYGTNVRMTNDPFSPPELEWRADKATVRRISPFEDELVASNSRLVFDQGLSLPFINRWVFDRRDREQGLFNIGFDDDERGGLFIERTFTLVRNERVLFQLTPQYFVQRALTDSNAADPNVFGLRGRLNIKFSDDTFLDANASLTSFDFGDIENQLRANVKLSQTVDLFRFPHNLTLEGNYRDRLFNGSLGFQTVQSSFGAVLASPDIPLGDSQIFLRYEGSIQFINADTDRADLLAPIRTNNRIDLTRYQGFLRLTRTFPLWLGTPLPPTAEEGLRYTPTPVQPNVQLVTSLTGVSSYYSSGDTQPSITGSVGISAQFGHFSRPLFDYTGFNVTYTQGVRGEPSPFLFDRIVDTRTLSLGLVQQIYGPFRLGFQSAVNLDTGQEISTDYFLEYSRRTHNIIFRYNPVLGLASISLRLSDFNWIGSPKPFEGSGARSVEQGVTR